MEIIINKNETCHFVLLNEENKVIAIIQAKEGCGDIYPLVKRAIEDDFCLAGADIELEEIDEKHEINFEYALSFNTKYYDEDGDYCKQTYTLMLTELYE